MVALANDVFKFNGWSNEVRKMETDFCYTDNKSWHVGITAIVRVTLADGTYATRVAVSPLFVV